jgi:catechol 2,3-dioxygenase-like lactoylglutathione lyase family enzyme
MGTLKRVAPIFPVRDLNQSLEYYKLLGFRTREYENGGYGFATCEGVEIHLGVLPDDSKAGPSSAYLFVDDADPLVQRCSSAGADVRLPEDTESGQHAGVLIDPDANVIRFGSPARAATTSRHSHTPDGRTSSSG